MRLSSDTLVVLVNGQQAKFIANLGTAENPRLGLIGQATHAHAAAHELGRDRPGHAMTSQTQRHTSFEQKDKHQAAEAAFLHEVVDKADAYLSNRSYSKAILFAETQALGIMRGMIKGSLKSAVLREVAKDYTKASLPELQGILAALD